MASATTPTHFSFRLQAPKPRSTEFVFVCVRVAAKASRRKTTTTVVSSLPDATRFIRKCYFGYAHAFSSRPCSRLQAGAAGDGDGAAPHHSASPELRGLKGDASVALFVSMLGIDKEQLDREQAVEALWRYSLGGKQCVDAIMQFPGCLILIVSLLQSDSSAASEAAAGLLREISGVSLYRDAVAESGAIEEMSGFLIHRSADYDADVLEHSLCTLWNLSVDEKYRVKIANSELLPLLIKCLNKEDVKVKEAAGGVLANLALSTRLHDVMVEAGVIPKLAQFLTSEVKKGSATLRKEARNALLELAKDDYYRILILEEGLVRVPLIGNGLYKSLKPITHSWPTLPDGTQIEQTNKSPSRFGANELLLGLSADEEKMRIEDAKVKALVGRTQQLFLARIGAIESEGESKFPSEPTRRHGFTLLPLTDGIARLVIILELEDDSAIARAAESIADSSINEHMRVAFKEAGAVKRLVELLNHQNNAVIFSVTRALERLSVSDEICQNIENERVINSLFRNLKTAGVPDSENVTEKTLDILARILEPGKQMRKMFYKGTVNGATEVVNTVEEKQDRSSISWTDVLDSSIILRLVEILKIPSPNLQRKAASILEFASETEACIDRMVSADIGSALITSLQQELSVDVDSDAEQLEEEPAVIELEESGLAISALSRLLTKLLHFKQFNQTIDPSYFTSLLRNILKSDIPLSCKDWVAACLVKICSLSSPYSAIASPIATEVTLYETIPRLIETIKSSINPQAQEAAAVELNRIVSEGIADSTRAVASEGGIFPLVKLLDEGTPRAVEAALTWE
uniref:ARM repeat superfamily protein n=1 Tax=Kalanchoe fedtschenkoi TaxID=63787 RepID=A0A7N0UBI9_KALFE